MNSRNRPDSEQETTATHGNTTREPAEVWPALLSVEKLANLLGVSKRTVHRYNSGETIPRPVSLGGVPRWRYDEIKAWIAAGCPDRNRWERDTKRGLRNSA